MTTAPREAIDHAEENMRLALNCYFERHGIKGYMADQLDLLVNGARRAQAGGERACGYVPPDNVDPAWCRTHNRPWIVCTDSVGKHTAPSPSESVSVERERMPQQELPQSPYAYQSDTPQSVPAEEITIEGERYRWNKSEKLWVIGTPDAPGEEFHQRYEQGLEESIRALIAERDKLKADHDHCWRLKTDLDKRHAILAENCSNYRAEVERLKVNLEAGDELRVNDHREHLKIEAKLVERVSVALKLLDEVLAEVDCYHDDWAERRAALENKDG